VHLLHYVRLVQYDHDGDIMCLCFAYLITPIAVMYLYYHGIVLVHSLVIIEYYVIVLVDKSAIVPVVYCATLRIYV